MKIRHLIDRTFPLLATLMLALFFVACGSDKSSESDGDVLSESTTDGSPWVSDDAPLDRIRPDDTPRHRPRTIHPTKDIAVGAVITDEILYETIASEDIKDMRPTKESPAGGVEKSRTLSGGAGVETKSVEVASLTARSKRADGAVFASGYADAAAPIVVSSAIEEKVGVAGEDLWAKTPEAEKAISDVEFDLSEAEQEPLPEAGQLTAGEWSDLREWDFWQSVIASNKWKSMSSLWGLGKGTRLSVRVDNGREPIVDAVVMLKDKSGKTLWTARSDNFGRAELFTALDEAGSPPPYDIVVQAGGKSTTLGGVDPRREQSIGESPLVARLDVAAKDSKLVEVLFAIDATGSMGDELNYIKSEIQNVIERATTDLAEQEVSIRLGANVYRDEGDEYLIRSTPMTDNILSVTDFLSEQYAGGGGDTPEAVEVALEDAIENHKWSDQARSRILFLVLDAPPHQTPDRLQKIRDLVKKAAEKGIRIIGLSGSGVDKETEFLMRFLGIHTGGTYTFLTDDSGIGGSHEEPTIGSHEIEFLNNLLVRLIVQYTDRPASLDDITPRLPAIH